MKPKAKGPLYAIRTARGLTQKDVAVIAGTDVSSIATWERGEHLPRGVLRFARLADGLGVSIDALLGREAPAPCMPDALVQQDRELLAAMEADASRLIGDQFLQRMGGWRTIARNAWLGVLIGARDRLLQLPPPADRDAAERVEVEAAQQRRMLASGKRPRVGMGTIVPKTESVVREVAAVPPPGWYQGWESPRQQARRLNQPEPAPRRITAKKAAKTRKLLTAGAQ